MPSHKHKILHRNRVGFVAQCPCCKEVHLRLGNLFTYMPSPEFGKMVCAMNRAGEKSEQHLTTLPDGKPVMLIQTPVNNLLINLSPFEFEESLELLNASWCLLQAEDALKPSNQQ